MLAYHTLDYDNESRLSKKGEMLPAGEEAKRLCEMADVTLRLHRPPSTELTATGCAI